MLFTGNGSYLCGAPSHSACQEETGGAADWTVFELGRLRYLGVSFQSAFLFPNFTCLFFFTCLSFTF